MSPLVHRLFAALCVVSLAAWPVRGEDSPKVKISRAGKAATALVQGKAFGAQQGSAFCIHPAGIFLTNAHVVNQDTTFTLHLNGGTKKLRSLTARVLRTDKELDLALLRVDGEKDMPTLPLATDNNLAETDEVIAFGFPFGQRLSSDQKEPPAVSVNVGKVTSLREKDGELHRIQLDAALNPGNSGGPVVNMEGKVVGIVVSGVPGSGVNFAIPINHVLRFLARPELVFTPPALTLATIHEPAEFQAKVLSFGPAAQSLDLDFILKAEGKTNKPIKMRLSDGVYRANLVPLPRSDGPQLFRLTARFARGLVRGEVADQTIQVGETPVQLSAVRYIAGGKNPRVWLRDGKILRDKLAGVESIETKLGPSSVRLDLTQAAEVRLFPPTALVALSATIVARRDGQEVGRLTRQLPVQGVAEAGEVEVFLDLEPPPLAKDVAEYALDASIGNVTVGGGGRYLILHLPKLQKLAVFDVNKAKIVKYLPAPDAGIKFVAGLDQLVVALPASRTLQRWSLETMELETSAPYPLKGDLVAFALGSASRGPVFVMGTDGAPGPWLSFCALALNDLQRRDMVWVKEGPNFQYTGPNLHLRASSDGKHIGLWNSGQLPAGITWIRLDYPIARSRQAHSGNGYVVPGTKGQVLFTSQGMLTHLEWPNQNKLYPGADVNGRYVPAHYSDYYLYLGAAPMPQNRNPTATPQNPSPTRGVEIHKLGVDKPLVRLDDIEVPSEDARQNTTDFTLDKRFHLIPQAKLLIVIPPSNDRLILHRVDLEEALNRITAAKK